MTTTDDLDALNCRQAANLGRARTRCPRWIDTVDVEAQVHRTARHLGPDFSHQGLKRLVPALFRLHHAKALPAAPVEVVGGIALRAQADLYHTLAIEQALLHRAPEGRAVGDLLAEHVVVDIGVSINMDEANLPMLAMQRAQDWQCNGVIAAERQWHDILLDDAVIRLFDDPHRVQQIEGVDGHVANIGD